MSLLNENLMCVLLWPKKESHLQPTNWKAGMELTWALFIIMFSAKASPISLLNHSDPFIDFLMREVSFLAFLWLELPMLQKLKMKL